MSKHKGIDFVVCDVCKKEVFGDKHCDFEFKINGKDYLIDVCSDCRMGNEKIKSVYRKMLDFFRT